MAWEDARANREKVAFMLANANVQRGDLVVLPEMFDTGFSFRVERTNDASGETLAFLAEMAERFGVTIQGGRTLVPAAGGLARNVMSVAAPGKGTICEYAKIHPFQREGDYFQGDSVVTTYEWEEAQLSICPAICYDLRFPELFRLGLLKGAQAFAIGACWPAVRAHHWRALLIARAIENQAFVFGVNRTGADPMTTYSGGTIAIGPKGDVLGELDHAERVLSVDVNAADVTQWREAFRAWRDIKLIQPA